MQCYNKVDTISIEEMDRLARQPNSVVISCGLKLNLDYLLDLIWEYLQLLRVYTKKRGGIKSERVRERERCEYYLAMFICLCSCVIYCTVVIVTFDNYTNDVNIIFTQSHQTCLIL